MNSRHSKPECNRLFSACAPQPLFQRSIQATQGEPLVSAFTLHTVLILGEPSTADSWRAWIEAEPDLYVIGDAGNHLAPLCGGAHPPDVIVLSADGSGSHGHALPDYLAYLFPDVRLLLVSGGPESCHGPLWPIAQVRGVINGLVLRETLVCAIRIVAAGGTFYLAPTRS